MVEPVNSFYYFCIMRREFLVTVRCGPVEKERELQLACDLSLVNPSLSFCEDEVATKIFFQQHGDIGSFFLCTAKLFSTVIARLSANKERLREGWDNAEDLGDYLWLRYNTIRYRLITEWSWRALDSGVINNSIDSDEVSEFVKKYGTEYVILFMGVGPIGDASPIYYGRRVRKN